MDDLPVCTPLSAFHVNKNRKVYNSAITYGHMYKRSLNLILLSNCNYVAFSQYFPNSLSPLNSPASTSHHSTLSCASMRSTFRVHIWVRSCSVWHSVPGLFYPTVCPPVSFTLSENKIPSLVWASCILLSTYTTFS